MRSLGWVEMHTQAKLTPALEEEVRRITRDEMARELARREHERRDEQDPTAEGDSDGE